MTNNKLRINANNTDFIILGTSRQRRKPTQFFPTNMSHSITPPDTVRNLGVTIDGDFNFRKHVSLTCRYISFSVAKTISTALITSRLLYCNFLLYNIASKDILKLKCIQNCLSRVVTRSPRFSPFYPISEISSLAPCSISHHFQTLHYCLSNSFFWRTSTFIFHALFSTQSQRPPSNSIVRFRDHLKTHLFRLIYPS